MGLLVAVVRFGESALLDVLDFGPNPLVLWAVKPDLRPVAVTNTRSDTSADGIKHVLGGVDIDRALGTVAGHVAAKNVGVRADLAEVHRVTATLEE